MENVIYLLVGAGLVFLLFLTAVRAGQYFTQRSAYQWLGEKWLSEIREERNKAEARAAHAEAEVGRSRAAVLHAAERMALAEARVKELEAAVPKRSRWVT